jgi:hypothetical protein
MDLFLVNAYGRRKLEGVRVVVSLRMAANGMAVGGGRAIAWVYIARGAVADANAECRAGLLPAGCVQYERATVRFDRLIDACIVKRARSK